jgi:hypothetical protein
MDFRIGCLHQRILKTPDFDLYWSNLTLSYVKLYEDCRICHKRLIIIFRMKVNMTLCSAVEITNFSTESTTSAFRVEDGGNIFLRSAGIHLQGYTMSQHRRPQPELSPLRKPQNVCKGRVLSWFWYLHSNEECLVWKRHKLTLIVSVKCQANPDQKSYCF